MLLYTSFLVAMFTAIILIPPLTYVYQKLGIVDLPSPRKIHNSPIPRVGGVAIVVGTVIPIIGWLELSLPMIGLLISIAILFLLGIMDDAVNLNYKIKFLAQIVAISTIFVCGFIDVSTAHYYFEKSWLVLLLVSIYFIFILGVTNAINLADGLDGLAGGEAILSFSIIALLAYESNNITILIIVLAVIGSIFGFLRFNTYPAKIFMGDTGSLFLGFILGLLCIALTYKADNAYSKLLPLLLVGLPIFDTLMVVFIRLLNGKSPFTADRNHLHHKLLDRGYKHYQSVLIIYLIQSIYILAAYFMRYDLEENVLLVFILISLVGIGIGYFPKIEFNFTGLIFNGFNSGSERIKNIIIKNTDILFFALISILFLYAISSIFKIKEFNLDIFLLLLGIGVVSMFGLLLLKNKPCHWIERVAIHIMIVLIIYYGMENKHFGQMELIHNVLLFLCVILMGILFFGNGRKQFIGSPLDFLLIATAIVIPNLPSSPISDSNLSVLILKLVVLFYCMEYVLFNITNKWWIIRSSLLICASAPLIFNFIS